MEEPWKEGIVGLEVDKVKFKFNEIPTKAPRLKGAFSGLKDIMQNKLDLDLDLEIIYFPIIRNTKHFVKRRD